MPSNTSISNYLLLISGLRKKLKWKNPTDLDSHAKKCFLNLKPGWYSVHARVRENSSGVNPTGHTLILDIAERSEQLLLGRSADTRRIIQLRDRVDHVMVSLEDNLDPGLCLDITLTRITRRRAKKRMLKRMNRRFDPVQPEDSIDNTEHVQIDMLRSHGHWPSIEELYQVYQQTNQRRFTPIPYASWLQDHLLALANHWRSTDWNAAPVDMIKLLVLTMNDSDKTVWQEIIKALQAILGDRSPSIQIVNIIDQQAVSETLEQSSHIVLAGSGIVPGLEFLVSIIQVLSRNEHCELLYTDHDQLTPNHEREQPVIKPGWDPYLLQTGNYIGDLCVSSTKLYLRTGGLEPGTEESAIYQFLLKACAELHRDQVIHVPGIMFSQPQRHGISHQDRWFSQHSDELATRSDPALQPGILEASPRVEIIIPTRDKEPLLRQCVESILELTDYPNYHITVVDNDSSEPATSEFHHALRDDARYDVLAYPGAFNYSAINNFAVDKTQSEVLILLNNDTQIVQSDWLTRMVQACMLPNVGCVGAKLLYANGRVQHAGVVMGMKGVAGHAFRFQKTDSLSYLHKLRSPHQVSAVTAACLAVRRDTFKQLGGLDDKELTVAFNDVDFCLRAHSAGYDNLLLPDVTITHHESLSRGEDDSPMKAARFAAECKVMHQRWQHYIYRDPYWNPLLSLVEEQPMLEAALPPVA